ncbi:MAG TPA: GWxTD domain-containing protein [Vicinamibacteria bacterium]|nr:GWxTD domain-containing protein [Vicinamibacteria bacterium]
MSLRLKPALAVAVAVFSLAPAAARADKLDKEDKKWLDEVHPLMLPDEEKTLRDLKDKADRLEFEKIFWARRDPDLDTPDNEFQAAYNTQRAEVDRLFKVAGQTGSATDCGRVYLLLGKPDEMKQDKQSGDAPSLRPPEVWTYRDRPGQTFAGGQVQIAFEKDCQLPQGARLSEQLNKVAESKIARPNLAYKKGPDGHIVKLVDQLPKPSPAQALLKTPRQDFPVTTQNAMMLRSPEGATYVAGLVRATGLPRDAGTKTAPVNVVVQALDAQGRTAAQKDRLVNGEFAEDGSVMASYGMTLRPGKYTLNVGVLDPKSGKGSVAVIPVTVPDLSEGELDIMPLVMLQSIQEGGATPDPKDPMSDFVLGSNRLTPSFDNVFAKSGEMSVIGAVYNATKDPTTGKASVTWGFSILKDGKPVAKTEDQVVETDVASPSIGPVPLTNFAPGKYVVQLRVRDNVAKKDFTKDAPFEVK